MPLDQRRRVIRRVAVTFACLAMGICALPWLASTGTVQRWLGLALVEAAEVATGERVSVGGVRVRPFERRLTVRGLLIGSASTGDTILAARSIEAVLGWEGFEPVLDSLTVIEPVLHLHLDEDGLREFRDAVRAEGAERPWRKVMVEDGALVLDLPGGQVIISDIDLLPGGDPVLYTLSVERIAVDHGRLQQISEPLRWSGIDADLAHVHVPQIELHFPAVSLMGELAARRGGALDGTLWASVELSELDPFVMPRRHLEGTLDLDLQLAGVSSAPLVSGAVLVSPWSLEVASRGTELSPETPGRTMSFGSLRGLWRYAASSGQLHLDHLEGPWADGWLSLQGSYDLSARRAQIELAIEQSSLETALVSMGAAPTPWVDLRMDWEASLVGSLHPIALEGPFSVSTTGFHVDGGPVSAPGHEAILAIPHGAMRGSMVIEPHRVIGDIERLDLPGGGGFGEVEIGLGSRGPLDLRLWLRDTDLSVFHPVGSLGLQGFGDIEAHVSGPFNRLQLRGSAEVDGLEVFGVPFADHASMELQCPSMKELGFERIEAQRGRTRYAGNLGLLFGERLTMDTQILVRDGYLSDLMGMFVDIPGVDARLDGTLDLHGEPLHLNGAVEVELEEVALVGERFAAGRASARMEDGIFTLRHLEVQRRGEAESLLLRGSVGRAFATNMELISDGLRVETLDALQGRGLPLEGGLQLVARARGVLMEPRFEGMVRVSGARVHGRSIPSSILRFDSEGSVVSTDGELLGSAVEVEGWADWSSGAYRFDLDLLELPVHLARPMEAAGSPVNLLADGKIVVRGQGGEPPDLDAELDHVLLSWAGRSLSNPLPWRFTRRGAWWQLEDVGLAGQGSWLRVHGEKLPERSLDLDGEGELELEWLRLLHPGILRAGGQARWTLSMEGGAPSPQLHLDATLQDGLVRTVWFPHSFEGLQGGISLGPGGYVVDAVSGRVGGGDVRFDGRIHARDWAPQAYDLHGELIGARVQYIDSLPPLVGDAELAFEGPVDSLVLSGDIDIHEMVFSERIDWESWLIEQERLSAAAPEETGDYFSMDIGVRAEGTGRIRNNVGNARLSAELRVVGDTSRPGVLGKVWAEDDGRVYLQERSFDISRGELHFIDPYTFDPELDFLFETDVRSRVRDYHIYYRVTGPFSAWRADASSDPALSQADINWLLLFGATRAELEEFGELEGALAWEGIDLLSKELGSGELLDRYGFGDIFWDRIDIVTGTTTQGAHNVSSEPRLLVEKDVPEPWDLTVSGELNVTRAEDWYLGLEKRIARRLYVTTYYSSIQYERSLNIGGAFGTELQLRWEVE